MALDVELPPQSTKTFSFALPISAKAVIDDQANLRAILDSGSRQYGSPVLAAEILPRFSWRVYPKSSWPLRADANQEIQPPLFLPADANATTAQFNIRVGNNTAQPMTLKRESLALNALPLRLSPGEEMQSTYTFNYLPGEKSALNPFNITLSDGTLTETVKVNLLTLRKGEAVAFAYDIDRDGFDDYVLENEFLRLIVSPNAGARAFALINKRTGQNIFTSIGGLRDKFVELDPADPTRNPRRKRGMYGTFNRAYAAEIAEGMGKQVVLNFAYEAPDVYPAGARIERIITLKAGEEFFTVDYRITPKASSNGSGNFKQAFWSASSIAVGDPANKARKFLSANGAFDFAVAKTRALNVASGWVAAAIDGQNTFGVLWRDAEVSTAEIEMKEFSSFVNVKFAPFAIGATEQTHTYRLAFYLGALPPERLAAERARLLQ